MVFRRHSRWRSCALVLMLASVLGAAIAANEASSTAGHGGAKQPESLLHCRQGPRGTYSSILRVSHEVATEELAVVPSSNGGSSSTGNGSGNKAANSSSSSGGGSQHAVPDAEAVANGTLLSSQLLLSKGYFLHVHATYDVTACTAAHTSYGLQLQTQSCHGFETGNGSATPETMEECTPDVGCRLGQGREVQACRQGCHHWLLRQTQATFKVDASGAFLADTLRLEGREWRTATSGTAGRRKTEQELERMWAECNNGRRAPAGSGEQGGGSSSPEQHAPPDATLRGLFDIFARQAHIRHDNVSEELHVVQATAYIPVADRRPGSATPSPDGSQRGPEHDSTHSQGSGRGSGGEGSDNSSSADPHGAHRPVLLTYTFNAESTVYPLHPSSVGLAADRDGAGQGTGSQQAAAEGAAPSADDGVGGGSAAELLSRLVLSRQYLVPSEQAHAAMGQYGTADLPAGHYSHTWLAPCGRVLMRVDATVTEAPLSAAPAAEPGTAVAAAAEAEGTATQRTSAQVQGTQGSRSRSGSSSNSTGSGDGYGGNGTRVASRVLTRMRLMVTSELLRAEAQGPCPASGCSSGVGCGHVGGEADCAGGSAAAHSGWRRRLAAAQHPAVVSHQQLLAARAADAYPDGGYDRFIEGWKQQLQDRRRHRRKQQRYGEQHEQQREENGQGPPPARRRSRVGGVESDSDTPHDGAHGPSQAYRAHVGSWRVSSVRRGGSSTGGSGISGSSSKGPHGARGSPTEGLAPGELRSSIIGSGTPIPNRRITQAADDSVCGNTLVPRSGFYIDVKNTLLFHKYMRTLLCKANEECQLGSYGWFVDDDDGDSYNGNPEFDVQRVREVYLCCGGGAQNAGAPGSAIGGSVQGVILKFDPGYRLGQLALTKSCRNVSEARHVFRAAPDQYLGGFYIRSEVSLLAWSARIISIEPSWLTLSPSTLPPSTPPPPSPPPPAWQSTLFAASDAEYVDGNQRLGMEAVATYKTGSSRYQEAQPESLLQTVLSAFSKVSPKLPPKRAATSDAEMQHDLASSYAGMTAPPLRIRVKARLDAVDDPVRGPRFTRVRTSKSFTALDGSYRAEIPWADHFLTSFLPLRPCNSYARGTTDYQPDRDSAARLLRISLRFRVWFLELRVSLVTSWTTSTLVKMCELDGVPALGVGAALAGETYGSLEVAINLFFVKAGVEFSMTTVSVNAAAFSTWTAGMLLNSDSQRPACTATDLLVRGLALSVYLNVRVFWLFRYTKEVWRSPGWTLVRKSTGLVCPNPADIRVFHRAAQQPPPPSPGSPDLLPSTAAQRATLVRTTSKEAVPFDAGTGTPVAPLCPGSLWLNGYYTYVSPAAAAYLTPDIRQRLQSAGQPAGDRDQQYATTALQFPALQPPTTTTTQRTAGPWSWLGSLSASAFPDAVQLLPYTPADLPCRWILSGPPGSALHYTLWYLDLHAGDSVSVVSHTVTNAASTAGVGAAAAGAAAAAGDPSTRTTTMSTPHAIFTGRVLPSKPVSGVIPLCCYQEVHIALQPSQPGSLGTTDATRTSGVLPRYGFFITFSVEPMSSPPPPPAAPFAPTPLQLASSSSSVAPEVCEGVLLMHDGLQSSPASGYVTSDLRWRLWADGTDPWADGSRAAWRRPDLPYASSPEYGDPGTWLMPYNRGSRCSWEFRLDAGTAVDFTLRYVNLLPGVDALHFWAPTSEAMGGDGSSSSGGGGGEDGPQQPLQQDWSAGDLDALLRNPAWHRSLRVLSHEAIGAGGPVVTLTVSEPRFFVTLSSPRTPEASQPQRRGAFLLYSVRQQPVGGAAPPPPPPLPPVPPSADLWNEVSLPPPPPPPLPPQLPAFPTFPPESQAPPAPAEPSAENAPLCLATFQVHDDNYTTPDGSTSGYLTHDLHRRRSVANVAGDGGQGPLALPPLPPGDPATWLPEYPPGLSCSWTFRTPPDTYTTLTLVFLDTERGMDLLRVTAPAPGPLPPGAPEQLPLASYSGATTDPWVAAHNPLTILTHHTFTVSFVSDFATQGRGFLMTYTVRPRPATWPPSPPPPPPPPPRPPPPVLCVPRLVVHDGQRVTSLEGSYVTDDLSLRLEQARNPVDAGAARVDPAAPAPAGVQPLPALPEGHPSTWLAHLYGPNAECSWVVRAPPDALIRVELRYLDTEQGYDQLLLEDDDTGQQLAAYTGRLPSPAPAITAPPATRALRLRFTSDAVPKYGGFYLRYWVLPPDLLAAFRPPPPPPYAKAALRSAFAKAGEGELCDPVLLTHGSGYVTGPGGAFITSDMRWRLGRAGVGDQEDGSQRPMDMARLQLLPPGDPGSWLQPYAPDTDCAWLLALPAAATATLVVSYLDLEPGGPDRLTISDHLTGEELAVYGGSSMGSPLPPLTLANTRVVQLRLTSDAARQGRGFVARYWVVHRAGLLAAPGSGGGGLGAGFAVGSSVTIRGPAVVQDVYAAGASCTSSTSSSSGSEVQLSASAALTFILDASEARDAVGLPFARASWSVLQAPPGPGPAAEAPQHAANEQGGANGGADGGADGGGAAGPWAALAAAVAAANSNATDWHNNMRLQLTHADALGLPEGTYAVRVELWAVGSEEAASATHRFLRLATPGVPAGGATAGEPLPPPSSPISTASLQGPVVAMTGPPHRVVMAAGGVELQAVDQLAAWGLEDWGDWAGEDCASAASGDPPRISWTWSIPPSLAALAATGPSASYLALGGPLGLAHGETVTLFVAAAYDSNLQGTEAPGAPPSPSMPMSDTPSSPPAAGTPLAPPLPPGSPAAPPANTAPVLQPSFSSASMTVTVLHSPPIAVLRGPSGDVPASVGRILLDASASWDSNIRPPNPPASPNSSTVPTTPPATPPLDTSSTSTDNSELLFQWVCWRPDDPDAACGLVGDSHPTRAQWDVPLSGLQPGTWHVFSVVVTLAPYDAVVGAPPLRAVASLAVRPQADADAPKPTAVPPLLPAVEVAENLRPGVQDSPTATAGNGTDGAELPTNFAPTAPHNLDQPLLLLLDARQVLWEATAGAAAPPPYTGPADAGPSGAWLDTTTIEWATGAGVVVGSSSFRAGAASLTPPPPAHIEAAAQKARTEEQQEQDLGSHADGVGSGQAGQRRRQQQELATPSSATTSALRVVNVPLPGVLLVAVPPAALLGLGQQQGAGEPAAAPGVAVLTATLKTPTSAPAPAPRIGGMTFTAALAVTLNQPPQCALRLGPVGPGDNTSACFTVEFVATAVARTGLSAAANASGTPAAAAGSLAGVRQGALAAMVVVRAVGFVDPEGHLPLSYEFGVRHPSLPGVGTDAVVQLGDDSQAVLLLPPSRRVASNTTAAGVDAHGGANGGSVQVYVCVTDALGARTCVDRLVPLAPGESPGAGGPGATGGAVTIGTAAVEGAAGAAAALQRHLRVLQPQPGSDPSWPLLRRSAWRAGQLLQQLAAAHVDAPGEAPGQAATTDGGVSPAAADPPLGPGAQEEQLVVAMGTLARVAAAAERHERVMEAASALAALASATIQLFPASPTLRSAAASAALSLASTATAQLDSLRATAPTGPGGRPAGASASAALRARLAAQVVGCACQALGLPALTLNTSTTVALQSSPAVISGGPVEPGYGSTHLLLGPHVALLGGAAAALARAAVPLSPPLAAGDAAAFAAAAVLPGVLLPPGQGGDGGPGGAPDEGLTVAVALCAGPGAPASWPHCEPLTQARAEIVIVGTNGTGSGGGSGGSSSNSTQSTLAGAAGVLDGAVSLQFLSDVQAVAAAVATARFIGASNNSSTASLNATVVSGLARVQWHAREQQQQQKGQHADPPGGDAPPSLLPQGRPPTSPGSAQPPAPAPPPPQAPEGTAAISTTIRLPVLLPYLDSGMALVCGRYEEAATDSGGLASTSTDGAGGEGRQGAATAAAAAAAGAVLLPAGMAEAYDPDSGTAGCRAAAVGWYLVLVMPEAQARAVWEGVPADSSSGGDGGGGGGGGSARRALAVGLAIGLVVGVLVVAAAVAFAVARRRRAARILPDVPEVAFKKDVSRADLSAAGTKGGGGRASDDSTRGQLPSRTGSVLGAARRPAPVSPGAAARLVYGQALPGDYPERLGGPPPATGSRPSSRDPLPPHFVPQQVQDSGAGEQGKSKAVRSGEHGSQQVSSAGAAAATGRAARGMVPGPGGSAVGKRPRAVRAGAKAALPPLEVGQDRAARLQALLLQGDDGEEHKIKEENQRAAERAEGK